MVKAVNSRRYNETPDITDAPERLPVGGYILKIMKVEEKTQDWGDQLIFSFDIAEGEHKDYFAKQYRSQIVDTGEEKKWKGVYRLNLPKDDGSEQDGWAMRRYKGAITSFNVSNQGLNIDPLRDWNSQCLVGKLVGAVFFEKEYDFNGRNGMYTTCHSLRSVSKIRDGDFKIPPAKMLNGSKGITSSTAGFTNASAEDYDDLPF